MIIMMFMYFFLITGWWKILSVDKSISILMAIEFVMISVFFIMIYWSNMWFSNSSMTVMFISLMVGESVMGLGAYIYMTRSSGKDMTLLSY